MTIETYLAEQRAEITMIRAQGYKQMDKWQVERLADAERQLAVIEAAKRVADNDESDGSDCPWLLGTGICVSGCYSEPACQTNAPRGGWPKQRLIAALAALVGEPLCR